MREVLVAGGYDDVLQTGLVDHCGSDLGTAQVWATVWPESADSMDYPPAAAPEWQQVAVTVGFSGAGEVTIPVDPAALGHFHLWLKILQDGRLWLVRVQDPANPDRPWHIWIH